MFDVLYLVTVVDIFCLPNRNGQEHHDDTPHIYCDTHYIYLDSIDLDKNEGNLYEIFFTNE